MPRANAIDRWQDRTYYTLTVDRMRWPICHFLTCWWPSWQQARMTTIYYSICLLDSFHDWQLNCYSVCLLDSLHRWQLNCYSISYWTAFMIGNLTVTVFAYWTACIVGNLTVTAFAYWTPCTIGNLTVTYRTIGNFYICPFDRLHDWQLLRNLPIWDRLHDW